MVLDGLQDTHTTCTAYCIRCAAVDWQTSYCTNNVHCLQAGSSGSGAGVAELGWAGLYACS
jgi:hypothetical protein